MKVIGGYFGLELNSEQQHTWQSNAIEVNSSRHALEYILRSLPNRPKLIHIPYYTCEVVLEPIKRLGIDFKFYHINKNLEIDHFPQLESEEFIIVNNYFGIKDKYVDNLLCDYGDQTIVDNAQAFYHRIGTKHRCIYSPRKFFGVPDGGYAFTPDYTTIDLPQDLSTERSIHLLRRLDAGAEAGYAEFQKDDSSLSLEPLRSMSNLTKCILSSINYELSRSRRKGNFGTLHKALSKSNRLAIPPIDTFACPMVYPYLTEDHTLRQRLIDNKIFVATYWPNVLDWCDEGSTEYNLAKNLIPLPIDQRYGEEDMKRIISIVRK